MSSTDSSRRISLVLQNDRAPLAAKRRATMMALAPPEAQGQGPGGAAKGLRSGNEDDLGAGGIQGTVPMMGSLVYFKSKDTAKDGPAQKKAHSEPPEVERLTTLLGKYEIREGHEAARKEISEPSDPLEEAVAAAAAGGTGSDADTDAVDPDATLTPASDEPIITYDPFNEIENQVDSDRRQSLAWFDQSILQGQSQPAHRRIHRKYHPHSSPQDHPLHGHHHNHHSNHHHRSTGSVPNAALASSPTSLKGKDFTITSGSEYSREMTPRRFDEDNATLTDTTDIPLPSAASPTSPTATSSPGQAARREHRRRLTCAMIFTKPKVVEM